MVYKIMLSKQILKRIKLLGRNGKPISFKKIDAKEGVKYIYTCCFVKEENVIVRGGTATSSFWKGKKVKIFAIDGTSNQLRGENAYVLYSLFFCFTKFII